MRDLDPSRASRCLTRGGSITAGSRRERVQVNQQGKLSAVAIPSMRRDRGPGGGLICREAGAAEHAEVGNCGTT
jgi:hypothetical protein